MNIVLLYLLLLKGTATAFAGLASLPVIQESLVNHYHVLTNDQPNEAVVGGAGLRRPLLRPEVHADQSVTVAEAGRFTGSPNYTSRDC